MDVIRTVLGDIDANKLGWCECRDHLFIASSPSAGDDETLPIDDYDDVVTSLIRYMNAGGGGIIDGQTLGRGRMGSALVKAAQQTDIPIIASTGSTSRHFMPPTSFSRSKKSRWKSCLSMS